MEHRYGIVLLVAVLLACVCVDSAPNHHRHHHRRHHPYNHKSLQSATHRGANTGPREALDYAIRQKRQQEQSLNVKDAQDTVMPKCNYNVKADINDDRIPSLLWTVTCQDTGCKCGEGTYTCVQLYTEMEVFYNGGMEKSIHRVNSSCVCASKALRSAEVPQVKTVE